MTEEQTPKVPAPTVDPDILDALLAVREDCRQIRDRLLTVEAEVALRSAPVVNTSSSNTLALAARVSLAESELNTLQRTMAERYTQSLDVGRRLRELEAFQVRLLGIAIAIGATVGFLSYLFAGFLGK